MATDTEEAILAVSKAIAILGGKYFAEHDRHKAALAIMYLQCTDDVLSKEHWLDVADERKVRV